MSPTAVLHVHFAVQESGVRIDKDVYVNTAAAAATNVLASGGRQPPVFAG